MIFREDIQFHASPREPPKPKQNSMLRRSNGNHNGNQRPTTAHRQTRQRAVNIAIHELKSQVYDQRWAFIQKKYHDDFWPSSDHYHGPRPKLFVLITHQLIVLQYYHQDRDFDGQLARIHRPRNFNANFRLHLITFCLAVLSTIFSSLPLPGRGPRVNQPSLKLSKRTSNLLERQLRV